MNKIIIILLVVNIFFINANNAHASKSLFSPNILSKKKIERNILKNIKHTPYQKTELIITSILPNPDGKDQGKTLINIKNPNHRNINLSGWYIENIKNKYIFSNRYINSDEQITFNKINDIFISLNNKRDVIKLFDPNDKLIQKLSYNNAPEGSFYYLDLSSGLYRFKQKVNLVKKIKNKKLLQKEQIEDQPKKMEIKSSETKNLNTYKKELVFEKTKSSLNTSPNQIPNFFIASLLLLSLIFGINKFKKIFLNQKISSQKLHQV